jgi:hypothetical protein
MTEDKISRICWNTEGWRKPSGKGGKTKHKEAYERQFGFGHEEWLLDTTKVLDSWHYAYLQPIGKHSSTYEGKSFNISLYSINDATKGRWWIGRILDVKVITPEDSKKVYLRYKKNGWLAEMEEQLREVGADIRGLRKTKPEDFVVIKFRPQSLELLDVPLEFSKNDPAIGATYYILLNHLKTPKLIVGSKKFEFIPGHKVKKGSTKSTYEGHSSNIDLVHNKIQTNIYQQLRKKFGKDNVGTESNTGYGYQVDIAVKDIDGDYIFYEIKTSYSLRLCIREALAQLLEYAYYPNSNNAKKLIIVSPNPINSEAKSYINNLRTRFKINIYYQYYNPEKEIIEDIIY